LLTLKYLLLLELSYIIKALAQEIADALKKYYLNVPPDQVITEADAIHLLYNIILNEACDYGRISL
jgi:hypothetical protein